MKRVYRVVEDSEGYFSIREYKVLGGSQVMDVEDLNITFCPSLEEHYFSTPDLAVSDKKAKLERASVQAQVKLKKFRRAFSGGV